MASLKYKNGSTWTALPKATNAGLGEPTVSAPGTGVGTPTVSVSLSGADTAKVFNFSFTNLRGATGGTGSTGPAGPHGTLRGYGQLYTTSTKSIYRNNTAPTNWSSQRILLANSQTGILDQRGASVCTISYSTYSIRVVTPSGSTRYLTLSFVLSYGSVNDARIEYLWAGAAQTNSTAPTSSSTVNCYNQVWIGQVTTGNDQIVSAPAGYTQAASSTWYYQMYARQTGYGNTNSPVALDGGTWLLVKDFGNI